jgi:hypothetical protein
MRNTGKNANAINVTVATAIAANFGSNLKYTENTTLKTAGGPRRIIRIIVRISV